MTYQEHVSDSTDELTNAVRSVAESFQPYRTDHLPNDVKFDRWVIWNDQTSERLGIVALEGPYEQALSLVEKRCYCAHEPWIPCATSSELHANGSEPYPRNGSDGDLQGHREGLGFNRNAICL
jgi:hypothetical protein